MWPERLLSLRAILGGGYQVGPARRTSRARRKYSPTQTLMPRPSGEGGCTHPVPGPPGGDPRTCTPLHQPCHRCPARKIMFHEEPAARHNPLSITRLSHIWNSGGTKPKGTHGAKRRLGVRNRNQALKAQTTWINPWGHGSVVGDTAPAIGTGVQGLWPHRRLRGALVAQGLTDRASRRSHTLWPSRSCTTPSRIADGCIFPVRCQHSLPQINSTTPHPAPPCLGYGLV